MELKSLSEFKPNPQNPRTISKADFEALKKSIQEFGDLSNLVWNETTGQLAGGHQRREAFLAIGRDQIVITEQYAEPNSVGTVAIGYILNGDEKFPVRVVRWSLERETAANIMANKVSGQWDEQLLAEANFMLSQNAPDLLALTGQSENEIEKLLQSVSGEELKSDDTSQEQTEDEKFVFKLTPDQAEVVHLVVNNWIRDNHAKADDNGSALYAVCLEYTRNHPLSSNEKLDEVPVNDVV